MRRTVGLLAALLALTSCGDGGEGGRETMVVSELTFGARTGEEVDGRDVSHGIDLDGRVSDRSDAEACNRADFVAPDGREGIDNQFTFLVEAINDVFQAGTVDGIIQGTINEGRLLLMIDVQGIDDPMNDGDVTVRLFLGEGRPDLSGEDRIVPNQTFDLKEEAEVATFPGRITDGVLEAGPFTTEIPVAVFNVFFDLKLHDAQLVAERDEDGTWSGIVGGGVATDQIMNVAMMADAMQGEQISPALRALLPRWVDMGKGEDGRCTQLSAALLFESQPAFVYPDVEL
ncbi:MAG TPA: hypothetical protein RMH85_11485 [Polyangiaceae bacterium LLY-WYZ-15_(1-7)]|nr:hypothetical protein [Polyangiaceae bacterium LLY-WYZ-15_(1-7)]HJL00753.1 hypothetical protein [Polyangiaceae bacterium LLY-WYZ-15_(1-7)]HJL09118.1 hypothetical protein [Polyangiaceae bacterium LLY-WYZ-15_(1-7)]HJL25117.1 hypothetical protein [Polyangiaceae bacterium LLY-WYZ-15_(1-7)]HJL28178.1 hypothetical protein [Polyangiaceae bacterium LLY-WYZ-15_(1-7)]